MKEIADHLMDLAQNALDANAATIHITVCELPAIHCLTITVDDTGCGLSLRRLQHATTLGYTTKGNSTKTTAPGLSTFPGQGLFLAKESAEKTGGALAITSQDTAPTGTRVVLTYYTNHPLCKPLGAVADTLLTLLVANPHVNWELTHRRGAQTKRLSTAMIEQQFGVNPPLLSAPVLLWTKEAWHSTFLW